MTQGDPLSMLHSNDATGELSSLQRTLSTEYADDSACAGALHSIHSWLDLLIERGPMYSVWLFPRTR